MGWKLVQESKYSTLWHLSKGSGTVTNIPAGKTPKNLIIEGPSVVLGSACRRRTYFSSDIREFPFGEAGQLSASFVGIDDALPRWYLTFLSIFKETRHNFLLEWNANVPLAILFRILQGAKPHYLDYPDFPMLDFNDKYLIPSTVNSPETRRKIKSALEDLSETFGGENNLSQIIYSNLLKA